jgi:hypothetical protein
VARHTTLSDARRTAAAVVLQPARGTRRSSTCWTCPLQRPPPPGRRRGMSRRPPAPRCRRRQTRKLSYQVGSLQVAGGSGGKTKQDHERSGGRETSTCSRPRTRPEGEVLQLLNAVSLPRRISERVNCRRKSLTSGRRSLPPGHCIPMSLLSPGSIGLPHMMLTVRATVRNVPIFIIFATLSFLTS